MFKAQTCTRPARMLFGVWASAYAAMIVGLLGLPLVAAPVW